METRDADAKAIRELWEIARNKEQDRRMAAEKAIHAVDAAHRLTAREAVTV